MVLMNRGTAYPGGYGGKVPLSDNRTTIDTAAHPQRARITVEGRNLDHPGKLVHPGDNSVA